jgi:hypothetical protein
MALPAKLLCPCCGYDRRSNYAHDPYAVCPECGDDRCPGELKPWPSRGVIIWRLMRVQVCAAVGVMAAVVGQGLLEGSPYGILGCVLVVARLLLVGLFLIVPFFAADALAEEFAPEQSRAKVMFGLAVLGWLGGLVLTFMVIAVSVGSAALKL